MCRHRLLAAGRSVALLLGVAVPAGADSDRDGAKDQVDKPAKTRPAKTKPTKTKPAPLPKNIKVRP